MNKSVSIDTLIAIPLPLWLKADNAPKPYPLNWCMDRVFKPVWTDNAREEDTLAFIPRNKRTQGYRSHSGLENNHTHGRYKAHPVLQRALDTSGPLLLENDLADRIKRIAITQSEDGDFGSASTRTFR